MKSQHMEMDEKWACGWKGGWGGGGGGGGLACNQQT